MKATILIALGLLAVIPAVPPPVPTQNATAPNSVERTFKPGGRIALDLSAGGYIIRGTAEDKIRVRWRTENPADASRVQADVVASGTNASIRTRGPKKNFRVEIDLPSRADLEMDLSAGDLDVLGIEGNKSLSMWAGDVTIEVGEADRYKSVDASVRFGELTLRPFGANKGGILRSFHWTGKGKYTLSAKLFAGDLKFVR